MRIIFLLTSVLMLSGCATIGEWFADDPIITVPVMEKFALIPATQPTPIETKEVVFKVISKKVFMEDLMKLHDLELDKAAAIAKMIFDDEKSLFTVNAKQYGNLGENMQEILRFMRQQKEVIKYYKENVPEPKKADAKEKN